MPGHALDGGSEVVVAATRPFPYRRPPKNTMRLVAGGSLIGLSRTIPTRTDMTRRAVSGDGLLWISDNVCG